MRSLNPGTNFGFYSGVFKLFRFEEPTMDLVWDLNDDHNDSVDKVLLWSQLMNGLAT